MKSKTLLVLLSLVIGLVGRSNAYDNGPKVIGCDFILDGIEKTDKCLIFGSGINQGISWLVFEVHNKKFRYFSSSPSELELLDSANEMIKTYSIRNFSGQCRPGGRDADIYSFENGERICLYW